MATITGSEVLAQALRSQGVDTMFLPDGRADARDGGRGASSSASRHRSSPRAGRFLRGPRVHARDAAPRCLQWGAPPRRHQSGDRRGTAFTDCAPLVAIGGASPRVYRHGGVPGIDQLQS